jgi:pSer/pThr/pTyr-binding forkhead associated (FHA) protein
MQMGRGPAGPTGNDVVIQEKRVSNRHCKVMLGLTGTSTSVGDGEPDVWIEDLKSSNGTFVSLSFRVYIAQVDISGQWRKSER